MKEFQNYLKSLNLTCTKKYKGAGKIKYYDIYDPKHKMCTQDQQNLIKEYLEKNRYSYKMTQTTREYADNYPRQIVNKDVINVFLYEHPLN